MIRNRPVGALLLGLALALTVSVGATAHEGNGAASLSVEPADLPAGGTVVLAGTGLEPDSDRVLVLAGPGTTLELGTVKTDADGVFQKEITIPSHMPAGSYELRAIGDETLTVTLALTASDGAPAPAGDSALETVIPHQRHAIEIGILGGGVFLVFLIGAGLIGFAERFGRQPTAAS